MSNVTLVGTDGFTPISATNPLPTTAAASSAIIGKVGIDQTTPGTTNGVQVNAALPAGANAIGSVTPTPNLDTGALINHVSASVGINGTDQVNASGHGINVVINITAITGTTPTLTVTLQGKDVASGVYYTILASAALNATGTTVMTVFPGAAVAANTSANAILPRTWRVISAIGGTTPAVTATVGASVIE